MKRLRVEFDGRDHNQLLTIFYGEVVAFNGLADDLVTSVSNKLQMRLNFSGNRRFFHTMRRSGDFVLLIPEISDVDVQDYIGLSSGLTMVWPLDDLKSLWSQLRYDPAELEGIQIPASHELLMIWLLSSKVHSIQSLDLKSLADAVGKGIIAEFPSEKPSIQDLIYHLYKGDLLLERVENFAAAYDDAINVYVVDEDSLITEWKAISLDHKYCLIGDQLVVGLVSDDI